MPEPPLPQTEPRLSIGQAAKRTASLEMITFTVKLYEDSLPAGTTDPVWGPPPADMTAASPADNSAAV
jgi:hypothetical protein